MKIIEHEAEQIQKIATAAVAVNVPYYLIITGTETSFLAELVAVPPPKKKNSRNNACVA
jgi:hypothetical protein